MGKNYEIDQLIGHSLHGTLTPEEETFLKSWLSESEQNRQLFNELTQASFLNSELKQICSIEGDEGWRRIAATQGWGDSLKVSSLPPKSRRWGRLIAAVLIGLLGVGLVYLYMFRGTSERSIYTVHEAEIKAPSTEKAFIKLADGRVVSVDSLGVGNMVSQGDVQLVKDAAGNIVYAGTTGELVYNTLVNPRGSLVVALVLNDGTKVWMNCESSLKYPVSFSQKERLVEVEGEAYFEVTKDVHRPFIVLSNGIRIEVLGTHFNVNTYKNELSSEVTLIEGAVKLKKNSQEVLLKPGQMGKSGGNDGFEIDAANIDKIMAWKGGIFNFEDDHLSTVVRQLERWYDVDIDIQGVKPEETYTGMISRSLSMQRVFEILKMTGLKFNVDGRKVTITSQ